jgi:hypothetical protein
VPRPDFGAVGHAQAQRIHVGILDGLPRMRGSANRGYQPEPVSGVAQTLTHPDYVTFTAPQPKVATVVDGASYYCGSRADSVRFTFGRVQYGQAHPHRRPAPRASIGEPPSFSDRN